MSEWGLLEWGLLFGGIIVLSAFLVAVVRLGQQAVDRRGQAMQRVAMEAGFTFEVEVKGETDPFSENEWDEELQLLRLGGDLRNMMRGSTTAGEVLVFDFGFYGRSSHPQTVAAFPRAGRPLPHFELEPEGRLEKILGMQNIGFDSHPQFSKAWRLRGRDEAAVRGLFSPDLLSFFETVDTGQGWRVEGAARWLLVRRDRKLIRPAEMRTFVEQAAAIAGKFQAPRASSAGGRGV